MITEQELKCLADKHINNSEIKSVLDTVGEIIDFHCYDDFGTVSNFIKIYTRRMNGMRKKNIKTYGLEECLKILKEINGDIVPTICFFSKANFHFCFLLVLKRESYSDGLVINFMWEK